MERKNTGNLSGELMSGITLDSYIKANESIFVSENIAELFNVLFEGKSVTKAALAKKAGISEVYLHQVFSGRRKPSRDRLLCLCIGLEAPLDEVQILLKHASYAQLYPKVKRDAVIIHGIIHESGLEKINDNLFAANEKTLF